MALFSVRFEGLVRDFEVFLYISLSVVVCTVLAAHRASLSLNQRLSLSFKQVPIQVVELGFLFLITTDCLAPIKQPALQGSTPNTAILNSTRQMTPALQDHGGQQRTGGQRAGGGRQGSNGGSQARAPCRSGAEGVVEELTRPCATPGLERRNGGDAGARRNDDGAGAALELAFLLLRRGVWFVLCGCCVDTAPFYSFHAWLSGRCGWEKTTSTSTSTCCLRLRPTD